MAIFYSFFAIGDSGVLTAALTESTPKYCVGRTVAYRSILGIGFGSATPAIFGFIIDITNNHEPIGENTNWILAFSFLASSSFILSKTSSTVDFASFLYSSLFIIFSFLKVMPTLFRIFGLLRK